jgi:hypothetical protein
MENEDSSQLAEIMAIREVLDLFPPSIRMPITLDLPRWTAYISATAIPNDISDVRAVIEYFNEVAAANSLQNTTAARKLLQALTILDQTTPETDPDVVMFCDRLAFGQGRDEVVTLTRSIKTLESVDSMAITTETAAARLIVEQTRKQLVSVATMSVPIFNIWDSISLIYTLCVEHVTSDLMAELHLFQFRTIVQILSKHWYKGEQKLSPSTVAATWSESQKSIPVKIAFATTCSGERDEKRAMQKARYEFAERLIPGLNVFRKQKGWVCASFMPGNCPEWLVFILVCTDWGTYSSICQNKNKDRIFKLCGYCEELAQYLNRMEIQINDLWDSSNLGVGDAVEVPQRDGFSYRRLMDYVEIQKEFGNIVGVCR